MAAYIPIELREQVEVADRKCCAYCQTSEANSGLALTVDHIHPVSEGGLTTFENLCLACYSCNHAKSKRLMAIDPVSGETAQLYHPRRDRWLDHFAWDVSGIRIEGLTATGRATVLALHLNNPVILLARSRWVSAGWHPPENFK